MVQRRHYHCDMLYTIAPDDFDNHSDIVACFVQCNDEFLLLHRLANKPQGNTWGLPAGKRDTNETAAQAMRRELQEETGIAILPEQLQFLGTLHVRYPETDFTYHTFKTRSAEKPRVTIIPREHQAYSWVTPRRSLQLPLIPDLDECIRIYCN